VKLPAAVAFPTDARLLQRIEASRRALPQNNIKSLRQRREPLNASSTTVQRVDDAEPRSEQSAPRLEVARPSLDRPFTEARPALHLVRVEELFLRDQAAFGRR
jgi:hypothetical protein